MTLRTRWKKASIFVTFITKLFRKIYGVIQNIWNYSVFRTEKCRPNSNVCVNVNKI